MPFFRRVAVTGGKRDPCAKCGYDRDLRKFCESIVKAKQARDDCLGRGNDKYCWSVCQLKRQGPIASTQVAGLIQMDGEMKKRTLSDKVSRHD